ncbi:transmembrane channel-like protein 5 [Ambystoma mexicanum]|uniref:transmembrane channel-like protein 5 n=1 Tax=Ambystoma mexicanum TaxID=8296 RepID=UPI0037E77299
MSFNYDEGLDNSAYHYSETLEIDRGQHGRVSPQRNSSFRPNPYDTYEDYDDRGQGMMMDNSDAIALSPMNARTESGQYPSATSGQFANPYGNGYHNPTFENAPEYAYRPPSFSYEQGGYEEPYFDRHIEIPLEGNETLIRRRNKPQSTLPLALVDDCNSVGTAAIIEQETAMYIKKLAEMSASERTKEIQKLPIVLKRKKELRNKVQEAKIKKSKKGASQINCCTECMYSTALSFRRSKELISDGVQALRPWQKILKNIGGKFGTSILSYFLFLKWLLTFNIFSFIVNFSFITIPQLIAGGPNNSSFSGLEILTGDGYFQETVLYYGFYTNETIWKDVNLASYSMQLAYIFTIGFYLLICFLCLVYSMAKSFRENFINPNAFSAHATKLLCAWDFSVTNEKAIRHKQTNLSTQIKEALSDILRENVKLTIGQRISRFLIHLLAWVISMGTAAGCCAAVYFLSRENASNFQAASKSDLDRQAATLVLPIVVAIINLIMPFVYSLFGFAETFENPRHEMYVLILRNVFLKISIIGVLCYYWLDIVAESHDQCWETRVGEDIYRLILFDFIFCLLGSFFGEFLRRIIGTKCCKKLGKPEFDIARNVLDLIYAQTLAWIGIFFSPLLPVIQIIKLFIIFYVKKVSLTMNCVPPRRAWRASQMTTVFIFLLFFPSFTGTLSVIGVAVWSRNSSATCGPFRNLEHPYSAISIWVDTISGKAKLQWLVWIYHNFIESVLFFFILTLIILIISYLYWQIIQGRKIMVKLLQEQIANEGKKKMFLLQELTQLQNKHGLANANNSNSNGSAFKEPRSSYRLPEQSQLTPGSEMHPATTGEGGSVALALAMRARQRADPEGNQPPGVSEALAIAMRAKQQTDLEEHPLPQMKGGGSEALAIAMRAKQQTDLEEHPLPQMKGGGSEALAIAMRAKQQADLEEHPQPQMKGGGSEALPFAMKARQQAQLEDTQLEAMKEFSSDVLHLAMEARKQNGSGPQLGTRDGGSEAPSGARQPAHSDGYQPGSGSDAFALAMRAKEQAASLQY